MAYLLFIYKNLGRSFSPLNDLALWQIIFITFIKSLLSGSNLLYRIIPSLSFIFILWGIDILCFTSTSFSFFKVVMANVAFIYWVVRRGSFPLFCIYFFYHFIKLNFSALYFFRELFYFISYFPEFTLQGFHIESFYQNYIQR